VFGIGIGTVNYARAREQRVFVVEGDEGDDGGKECVLCYGRECNENVLVLC
jgi:hypothetical protein